jgi:NAD(P)H-dependent FMN reductase
MALSESLAINLYLAKRYGREGADALYPDTAEAEAQAIRWTLFAQGHLEPWVQKDALLADLIEAIGDRADGMVTQSLGVLERVLSDSLWLLGDTFTVADLNVAAVLSPSRTSQLELSDYPLPVFDQDLEAAEGLPENGAKLKELFRAHDGLLIASPEYNSSLSAALKNAIDWVSRPEEGRAPLDCFAGKAAGLLAASPGALGGLRGLVHLRAILGNIQVLVIPQQFALASAHEAFDEDGALKDEKKRRAAEGVGTALAQVLAKLSG